MKNILLAGLINIESTVAIREFPIEYSPIDFNFFGINTSISGVGYNVCKALKTLGSNVDIFSYIGNDIYKDSIISSFKDIDVDTKYLMSTLDNTPQSIIAYDKNGKRKIILDLKDIQDNSYPINDYEDVIKKSDIVIPCNINFSKTILQKAKQLNKLIACDVHVVDNVNDEFNKEFMQNSNILFMSNENVIGHEKDFITKVSSTYDNDIIVMGLGDKGALLYTKQTHEIIHIKAVTTRKIVNTVGAGDALFSAFIHFYINGCAPKDALINATIFASYKIGTNGGANGFLSEKELLNLKTSL